MDKNTVIGFILIAGILVGFSMYQNKQAQKQAEIAAIQDSIARANMPVEDIAVPETAPVSEFLSDSSVFGQNSAAEVHRAIYADAALESAHNAEAEIITLENELVRVAFNSKGAQPYSVMLKDYFNYDSTELYIFKPDMAQLNISVYAGQYISTKDFVFQIAQSNDTSAVFRLPFSDGGYIEQSYILEGYNVKNLLSFVGVNSIPRNAGSIDFDFAVTMPRMEKGYKNETQYSKLDYYFEGDKKPEEAGKGGRSAEKRVDSGMSWFACQQQFFSAIVYSGSKFASGNLSVEFKPESDPERNLMTCSARMRQDFVKADKVSYPFEFYFGPNHYQTLKSYDRGYEKIIPLGGSLVGWFTKYAIIPLFNWLNRYFANFGLIILLMTLIIKTVVFPLTYKSYASSAKMSALKPEIEKINEKFPHTDNQQEQLKKQQATMELYKRAGVSPMGGCLPTLLTFPILWAMFRFFPASIELRQQPFLWCHDLSAYDSIVDFGRKIPLIGDHLSLFALLMAVTMFFYSKLTVKQQAGANDPTAQSMQIMSVWMMPIMMFFICNNLSSALSYYYLLSQLIAMVQIYVIRKFIVHPEEVLAKLKENQNKPVPKSKWQQRLEEAQKMQRQQASKR